MIEKEAPLGRRIGEKAIRMTIAVVGLLVLRLILSMLPMLRHPIVYLSPTPAGIGAGIATIDVTDILQEQRTLKALSPDEIQHLQQALGAITLTQGQDFEKTYDQVAGMNTTLGRVMADALTKTHVAILPITIADALIDSLIFVVLLLFGSHVSFILRSSAKRLPQTGPMLHLAVASIVVALAYQSYKGILYPFLLPDNVELYGWAFLALGLAPLVGIGVLVARHMDAISSAVMQAGSSSGAGVEMRSGKATGTGSTFCSKCGLAVAAGAKFCPNCATPVTSGGKRYCASCREENSVAAKFCGGCGQALAD